MLEAKSEHLHNVTKNHMCMHYSREISKSEAIGAMDISSFGTNLKLMGILSTFMQIANCDFVSLES